MRELRSLPIMLCLFFALAISGCATPGTGHIIGTQIATHNPEASEPRSEVPATIKIASWNIRDFGNAKATNEGRMKAIAAILKGYDIIAVQETSNVHEIADPGCPRNDNSCPGHPNCNLIRNAFERYLNQEHGLSYRFVFSPQVKDERYLYIYNPDKISLEEHGLVDDPSRTVPNPKRRALDKEIRAGRGGQARAGLRLGCAGEPRGTTPDHARLQDRPWKDR